MARAVTQQMQAVSQMCLEKEVKRIYYEFSLLLPNQAKY